MGRDVSQQPLRFSRCHPQRRLEISLLFLLLSSRNIILHVFRQQRPTEVGRFRRMPAGVKPLAPRTRRKRSEKRRTKKEVIPQRALTVWYAAGPRFCPLRRTSWTAPCPAIFEFVGSFPISLANPHLLVYPPNSPLPPTMYREITSFSHVLTSSDRVPNRSDAYTAGPSAGMLSAVL